MTGGLPIRGGGGSLAGKTKGGGGSDLKNDVMTVHIIMYGVAIGFVCVGGVALWYGRRIARFQPPAPIKHNVDTGRLAPCRLGPLNYFRVSFIFLLPRVPHSPRLFISKGRTQSQTATATWLDLKPADTKNLMGANRCATSLIKPQPTASLSLTRTMVVSACILQT